MISSPHIFYQKDVRRFFMPKILKTKKQPKNQNKCFLYLTSLFKGFIILFLGFLLISLLIYKVKDTEFYYFSLLVNIKIQV